jgi:hypothetical protein
MLELYLIFFAIYLVATISKYVLQKRLMLL